MFTDALEPFTTILAAVILPLYTIRRDLDIYGSPNSTHLRTPHHNISTNLFKII